jgi:hypothetical protein
MERRQLLCRSVPPPNSLHQNYLLPMGSMTPHASSPGNRPLALLFGIWVPLASERGLASNNARVVASLPHARNDSSASPEKEDKRSGGLVRGMEESSLDNSTTSLSAMGTEEDVMLDLDGRLVGREEGMG